MEWDFVSEDILLVVKGVKIPVDLSVLLAPGRRGGIQGALVIYYRHFQSW